MTKGFKITCQDQSATILMYGPIGKDFDGGISDQQFASDLGGLNGVKQIDLRINSPGGNVFEGHAIFNLLKAHQATIAVYIDGVAASIASVIAMAGNTIEMAPNSMMMIHDPTGLETGTADEHRKMAGLLDKLTTSIAEAYAARTGRDASEFAAMMQVETWFDAQQALAIGLADTITTDTETEATTTTLVTV